MSPFAQALGVEFAALPETVRRFHDGTARQWRGTVNISHGTGILARLGIWLGGFPPAGHDLPFTISVARKDSVEHWTRDFDGHVLRSVLRYDPSCARVYERFGPISCAMALHRRGDMLSVEIERLWFIGMPVPRRFVPRSDATETQNADGAFAFDIAAALPGGAPLIRYWGQVAQA